MPGWLIGAALGAGLSALQSAQANADQKRAKRKYLEYLDKIKVNPLEEQKLLDSTGDVYMGQTMDAMNSSVGQGNLYNKDTAMALVKAKGLNARAAAQAETEGKIMDFNKGIDMKKAEAELQMPDQSFDWGAVAAGAMSGAQLGMGIESAMAENAYLEKMGDFFTKGVNQTGLEKVGSIGAGKSITSPMSGLNINIPEQSPMLSATELFGNQPVVPVTSTTKGKGKRTGYLPKTNPNLNLPGLGFSPVPLTMGGGDLTANQNIPNTPSRGTNQWWQGGTKRMPEMVMEQPGPVNYVNNPYQIPNYNTIAETSTTAVNKFGQLKKGQQVGYLQNFAYQNALDTPVESKINPKILQSERGTSELGMDIPGLDTPTESALDLAAVLPIGTVTNRLAKQLADRYAIKKGVTGLAKFKAGRSKFLNVYEKGRAGYIDKMLGEGKTLRKPAGFNYWQ